MEHEGLSFLLYLSQSSSPTSLQFLSSSSAGSTPLLHRFALGFLVPSSTLVRGSPGSTSGRRDHHSTSAYRPVGSTLAPHSLALPGTTVLTAPPGSLIAMPMPRTSGHSAAPHSYIPSAQLCWAPPSLLLSLNPTGFATVLQHPRSSSATRHLCSTLEMVLMCQPVPSSPRLHLGLQISWLQQCSLGSWLHSDSSLHHLLPGPALHHPICGSSLHHLLVGPFLCCSPLDTSSCSTMDSVS